jgi:hypothetical protein
MHFQIMMKERPMKCIIKGNHIFRISILMLHVSALQERHLQGAQSILTKLCVCYVISAEYVKVGSGSPSVCCQPQVAFEITKSHRIEKLCFISCLVSHTRYDSHMGSDYIRVLKKMKPLCWHGSPSVGLEVYWWLYIQRQVWLPHKNGLFLCALRNTFSDTTGWLKSLYAPDDYNTKSYK